MTQTAARRAIYQRFQDEWDPADGASSFDNEAFVPPQDKPWVRLAVRHQARAQETLGPPQRRWRSVGEILVQMFVPRDQGLEVNDDLAQAVRDVFEAQELAGGVRCYATTVREVGVDGTWFMSIASTAFDYDEFR